MDTPDVASIRDVKSGLQGAAKYPAAMQNPGYCSHLRQPLPKIQHLTSLNRRPQVSLFSLPQARLTFLCIIGFSHPHKENNPDDSSLCVYLLGNVQKGVFPQLGLMEKVT